MARRRTPGRSEDNTELEEQLTEGLEESFPASDPPAVVSTAIPGGLKKAAALREEDLAPRQPAEIVEQDEEYRASQLASRFQLSLEHAKRLIEKHGSDHDALELEAGELAKRAG